MNDEQLLTTDEAVEYLQINHRTLYRLLKVRAIPALRVGRQWRFRRSDLRAWVEARRARSNTDGRIRVLVVDDDPQIGPMIAEALSMGDFDVDYLYDAPAALERLQHQRELYGLLITDLKMPGMDGLTLIREVRHRAIDLPIVIITGESTEESAITAINLGVTGYLRKPFTLQDVLTVAGRSLGLLQVREEVNS